MEWKKNQVFESDATFVKVTAGGYGKATRLRFYFSALDREENVMASRAEKILRVMMHGHAHGRFRMVGIGGHNRTISIVEVF